MSVQELDFSAHHFCYLQRVRLLLAVAGVFTSHFFSVPFGEDTGREVETV